MNHPKPFRMCCFAIIAVLLVILIFSAPAQTPPFFNVKNYGATGNGTTVDTAAINAAVTAANAAGGGTVTFPAGNYASVSIHLTNNVTLYLSNSAVILAANSTGMDFPEANPYVTCSGHTSFPDFGHQHFHNALIWGENLTNIGITGPGTINGNALIASGDTPPNGQADKAIALKRCTNVVVSGVTITRAGHFGILANGCRNYTMTNTTILNATLSNHRDAINLINSSDCYIANCQIEGSDDAMCLKADWALGQKFTNSNIVVENCTIRSTQNNATQFGSETVGDFYNVRFSNLNLTEAGKAGIGITSNDGSIIDGVTYDHITMTNCACTIHIKISNQNRYSADCDPHPVGRIRNISISDVVARHSVSINSGISPRTNTATIAGYGESGQTPIPIENIVLRNVDISTIGGLSNTNANIVPDETQNWTPNSFGPNGVRPSYGWYIRHAKNISFINCRVRWDNSDGRPALIADDVNGIKLDGFVADVNAAGGNASPYDLGFTNVTAFDVANATDSNNVPLRISSSLSTSNANVAPPLFTPGSGAYNDAQSVALSSTTAGATLRYTMDGTTPTPTLGTIYSSAINVGSNAILKAVAYAAGQTNSAVNTAIYDIYSFTPVVATSEFDPPAGTYAATQLVAIASTTSGATIRFTTDGTEPSATNGTIYSAPVPITASSTTLKAIAYATNMLDSVVNSGDYVITGIAGPPTFNPPGGTYTNVQSVTISSTTGDATIFYTTDGSTPTSSNGTIYSTPVAVDFSQTLKAIAYADGAADSGVASASYSIVPPPPALVFEGELIPFVTNGAVAAVQSDVNSSNGKWMALQATADGQWIEYTLANVPGGTYQLSLKYKGNNSNRGIITHSVDGNPLGDSLDLYSSAQTYPETNLGVFTFASNGSHTVRQTVVGKNPAGSGARWTSADKFTLTLVQPPPPNLGGVAFNNDAFEVNASGYPNLQYRIQANDDLSTTNWQTLGTVFSATNGTIFFSDPNFTNSAQRFYRLSVP